jgi:hypothetical protein
LNSYDLTVLPSRHGLHPALDQDPGDVAAALAGARARAGRPRSKLATRALPAALLAALAAHAARHPALPTACAAAMAFAVAALAVARYRRRGPDRAPCAACPERSLPSTCAGYRAIVRRERAFRRLAASAPAWRPRLGAAPGRTRLAWTAGLELWLVEWAPGTVTPVHDHGGAVVALTVLDGTLVEDCLDATIWTTCRRTTFRAGTAVAFEPGHVHRLAAGGGRPAASVHAWSPRWPAGPLPRIGS